MNDIDRLLHAIDDIRHAIMNLELSEDSFITEPSVCAELRKIEKDLRVRLGGL